MSCGWRRLDSPPATSQSAASFPAWLGVGKIVTASILCKDWEKSLKFYCGGTLTKSSRSMPIFRASCCVTNTYWIKVSSCHAECFGPAASMLTNTLTDTASPPHRKSSSSVRSWRRWRLTECGCNSLTGVSDHQPQESSVTAASVRTVCVGLAGL